MLSSSNELPLHVASQFIKRTLGEARQDLRQLHLDIKSMQANVDAGMQEQAARMMVIALNRYILYSKRHLILEYK